MRLAISDVEWDDSIYPRTQADWRTIWEYQDAMKIGNEFPPILVGQEGGKHFGIDGRHRFLAAQRNKLTHIEAKVTSAPRKEWYILAIAANRKHGRPLSVYEKMLIAERLRAVFKFSDRRISDTLGMTLKSLRAIRDKRVTIRSIRLTGGTGNFDRAGNFIRTGSQDNTVLKSSFEHLAGTRVGADVEEAQQIMGVTDQKRAIEQVVAIARVDQFDLDDDDIRALLIELYDWLRSNRPKLGTAPRKAA